MRQQPIRPTAMAMALVMAATALLVCACVPTDRSIVTGDVQVFEPGVVGDWKWDETTVTLAKHGDGRSYALTMRDAKGAQTGQGVFRLMKLGDQHFYEIEMRNEGEPRPSFVVGRLTIDPDRLTGWSFGKDDEMLKHDSVTTIEIGEGSNKQRVVAMESEKVQAFLKAHAKEMSKEAMRVERVKAEK